MNKTLQRIVLGALFFIAFGTTTFSQEESVARQWNDILLESIRASDARPTVHARNLYHISMGMYEAWAVFDESAEQILLGKTLGDYPCEFDGFNLSDAYTVEQAREIAISYASYRLMLHRYQDSGGFPLIQYYLNTKMFELELDGAITTVDYTDGTPHSLGNYIAQEIILYGYTDNSNEINDYANQSYTTVNDTLFMEGDGNPNLLDPNRWQPLGFTEFVGQAGDTIFGSPDFLSPEWGVVTPFALTEDDLNIYERDGFDYWVYHDPGDPAYLDTETATDIEDFYKWNHTLTAVWSSHLDPLDGYIIDASPNATGNIPFEELPTTMEEYQEFYNYENGGDASQGYDVNPYTGLPYEPQYVPRGDYGRVLAEFWADGPDSETPPGHWFTLLNEVNDNPLLVKKWQGKGELLNDLEWDVKTYVTLGGAVHDAAICAWGIKGWYDYIRPVSAIRWMADNGQSTDPNLPSYDINGIPLTQGKIELVSDIDPLAGEFGENVGKIKLYAWKGPDYISNPNVDEAGVDWILAEDWWPYQRPNFVTPPFAGYVSGHSTFSRAAAEVMTLMTGSEYFPGGLGVFEAPMNSFLVFEDGPSQDIEFQWATYQDASDQCSLSRIWGGIHPPVDDIPGRKIGYDVGHDAFAKANDIFDNEGPRVLNITTSESLINSEMAGSIFTIEINFNELVDTTLVPDVFFSADDPTLNSLSFLSQYWADCDQFVLEYTIEDGNETLNNITMDVLAMFDPLGNTGTDYTATEVFNVDTEEATVTAINPVPSMVTDAIVGDEMFSLTFVYSENMDQEVTPISSFPMEDPLADALIFDEANSFWASPTTYVAVYDVIDGNVDISDIDVAEIGSKDLAGNDTEGATLVDIFTVDTENPFLTATMGETEISDADTGTGTFTITVMFNEAIPSESIPMITFPDEDPLANTLSNPSGMWLDMFNYEVTYDVADANEELFDIDILVADVADVNGNLMTAELDADYMSIDTKNPGIVSISATTYVVDNNDTEFEIMVIFDEDMDEMETPTFSFPIEDPSVLTESASEWINASTYVITYDVNDDEIVVLDIDVEVAGATDLFGNEQSIGLFEDYFDVNTMIVGVEELAKEFEGTLVYPNPVGQGQELIIELSKDFSKLTYQVFDINGKVVAHQDVNNLAGNKLILNTSNWSSGMYFVNLYSEDGRATFKVDVE